MTTTSIMPHAFAVWFKDLHRWNVNSFHESQWQRPISEIKKLACAFERRSESIDKTSFELKPEHFISLRFSGEVEPRNLHGKSQFKGTLFFAYAGDLIYSKIDVRNGAIGIIPDIVSVAAVTSEFPVYRINSDVALPEYVQLVFRTQHFRRTINGMVSGTSGRKRIQPDDLENVEIPLPPLPEQEVIVAHWRKAQSEITSIKTKVAASTIELEHNLLNQIGLHIEPPIPQKGAFALFWGDMERWDTFFYRKDFVALKQSLARSNRKQLGALAHFTSRPWNIENFPEGFFKYVEISSVNKEDGIFSSRTVALKDAPSRATTLIRTGDMIISTTRPYLGAIAIVPEAYNNHVCSSGFSLIDSVEDTHILKEYLLFFLKSRGGLKQLEQRMTGGLYPAITQDELEKIEIPIPPLSVQKEIVERIAAQRREINRERKAAERLSRDVNAEIEDIILGVRTIKGA